VQEILIDTTSQAGDECGNSLVEPSPAADSTAPKVGLMKQFWRIFGPDPLTADECVDSLIRARDIIDFDPRSFVKAEQQHLLAILPELVNYAARSSRLRGTWYAPVVATGPALPAGSEFLRSAIEGVLEQMAAKKAQEKSGQL
jgi:hypothetical protein